MRFDKNTGKTVGFACVILFAGILFSTWVLPAVTGSTEEETMVTPVTLNNPQRIIESPPLQADPEKMYPSVFDIRVPLNSNQIDETVAQARDLFLKNVSEDVDILFNLKIDSVIMEKYAEIWRVEAGSVPIPSEPPVAEEPQTEGSTESSGEEETVSSEEVSDQDPEETGGETAASEHEQFLAQQQWQEAYDAYLQQLSEYNRYLYEQDRGDAFFLDILFTDARSTTWRITASGYADEVFSLHCVRTDVEETPVSIYQEGDLTEKISFDDKMDSAISLFYSRIDSVKAVNDILEQGYSNEFIEMALEAPGSDFYWHVYWWETETQRALVAGFREDSNTPVCFGFLPVEENLEIIYDLTGYDPSQ